MQIQNLQNENRKYIANMQNFYVLEHARSTPLLTLSMPKLQLPAATSADYDIESSVTKLPGPPVKSGQSLHLFGAVEEYVIKSHHLDRYKRMETRLLMC